MKKMIFLLLGLPVIGFCDTKISGFTSTTTLNTTDIIPVVVTPGTTPANRIITFQNFYNSIPSTITAASLGVLTTSSATATYLQQSSATTTYLQISSATANYPKLGVGNLFTQSNTYSSSSTFNGTVIVSTSINAGGQGTNGQFLTSGGPNGVVSWTSGGSGDAVKASTQTWTGQNNWTSVSPSSFTSVYVATKLTVPNGSAATDAAAFGQLPTFNVLCSSSIAISSATTAAVFVPSNLGCSAALSNSSHHIYITANATFSNNGSGNQTQGAIFVDGINLDDPSQGQCAMDSTVAGLSLDIVPCFMQEYYLPGDTSSHAYRVYFGDSGGTQTMRGNTSRMIIFEVP